MEANTIRALLVDDDQGDYEMTRAVASQIENPTVQLDWVSTFEEGRDAFEAGEHDIYIVDYFLEDRTGIDLLKEASRQRLKAPVIMLTGRGSHEVDKEAMRAGAVDYLVKGQIDSQILERAIRYALDSARAREALKESEERHRSMFDHLPIGLYRCTSDGRFLDANPALVRILGYPDPQTLENSYASLLYLNPADRPAFAAGDFNTPGREVREQNMLGKHVRSGWTVAHELGCGDCKGTQYYRPDDSWSFIDMILWSPGEKSGAQATWNIRNNSVYVAKQIPDQVLEDGTPSRFQLPEGTGVSDHWPLVLSIELD